MEDYKYIVVVTSSSGYDINKSKTIARKKGYNPYERYDIDTKEWVTDFSLSKIHSGGLEYEIISKDMADHLISRL